jgi:hypothetical protein
MIDKAIRDGATKIFNGKTYLYWGQSRKKKDALGMKSFILDKDRGFVRVTSYVLDGKKWYVVWVRGRYK